MKREFHTQTLRLSTAEKVKLSSTDDNEVEPNMGMCEWNILCIFRGQKGRAKVVVWYQDVRFKVCYRCANLVPAAKGKGHRDAKD